jgi:PDZ domain-containing secreted protein
MNLLKKYKYFIGLYLVFFLFVIISSIIKVPYDIISPAGINEVENVIEIDTDNEQSGSINTVSVYSYDKVSLLTYIMALFDKKTTVSKTYQASNLSNALSYKSGTIQKEVSITNALIAGYNLAKMYGYDVDIKYSYKGYIIDQYYTYMTPNTIQIGDIVTAINEYSLKDYPISTALSKAEENDKDGLLFKVLRNDQELEFTLTRNEYVNYYGQKSSGYGLGG